MNDKKSKVAGFVIYSKTQPTDARFEFEASSGKRALGRIMRSGERVIVDVRWWSVGDKSFTTEDVAEFERFIRAHLKENVNDSTNYKGINVVEKDESKRQQIIRDLMFGKKPEDIFKKHD